MISNPNSNPVDHIEQPDPAQSEIPPVPMSTMRKLGILLAAVVIPVALALAAYSLARTNPISGSTSKLPARFQLDLNSHYEIPAPMVGFRQRAQWPVDLQDPCAIAIGPNDTVYVAGDQKVSIYESDGSMLNQINLETEPSCLAVAGSGSEEPGRTYIGTVQGVLIYGPDGTPQGAWPSLGAKSVLTAIALAMGEVFVADAGHRLVLRYDSKGRLLGRIGAAVQDRDMPGFIIPSPYFDLVAGSDMMLYIVNPGARRIECYTLDGQLQSYWGKAGSDLDDFFGCCNPAHLARMHDGQFVTSEKGIPRIKIYSDQGDFETVVAGPSELGVHLTALGDARTNQSKRVFDVAANDKGEVLVLDARGQVVRIFAPKVAQSQPDREHAGRHPTRTDHPRT